MYEVDALLREYDRARAYTDELWKDLSPGEVTWRPHENFSAIGWHLGHQAHVAHFMTRNLAAAEPSPDPALDAVMDSATPEPGRGGLPDLGRLASFRQNAASSVHRRIGDIRVGGGLSGLNTTRLLQEAGADCQLFEARDRLGGRILTVDGTGRGDACARREIPHGQQRGGELQAGGCRAALLGGLS